MASDGTAALWRLVARGAGAIVSFNQNENGIPFYCVHALGGGAPSRQFMRRLGDDALVYGIQAPRELFAGPGVTSIEDLAGYYVNHLTALQPSGALMLGGDSVGATIALEMAQQLRASGRDVALLVVFDGILHNWEGVAVDFRPSFVFKWISNVPQWLFHQIWWEDLARRLVRRLWRELRSGRRSARLVRAATMARAALRLRRETRVEHGAVRALHPNAPEAQVLFSRTLWDAAEAYVPRLYNGPVVLYLARTRPLVPHHATLGIMIREFQVKAAWKSICHNIETVRVWGTHPTMLDDRWAGRLATDLRARFAKVRCQQADANGLPRETASELSTPALALPIGAGPAEASRREAVSAAHDAARR
jgi:thioesterase domain-containing protein